MARNTVVKNEQYPVGSENDPLAELSRIMGLDSPSTRTADDDVDFGIDLEKELLGDFDGANSPVQANVEEADEIDALFEELARVNLDPVAVDATDLDFSFDASDLQATDEVDLHVQDRTAPATEFAAPALDAPASADLVQHSTDSFVTEADWVRSKPASGYALEETAPAVDFSEQGYSDSAAAVDRLNVPAASDISFEDELSELLDNGAPEVAAVVSFEAETATAEEFAPAGPTFPEQVDEIGNQFASEPIAEPAYAQDPAPQFEYAADNASLVEDEFSFDLSEELVVEDQPQAVSAEAYSTRLSVGRYEIPADNDTYAVADEAVVELDEVEFDLAQPVDTVHDERDAAVAGLGDDTTWISQAADEPAAAFVPEPATEPVTSQSQAGVEPARPRFTFVEPLQPAAASAQDEGLNDDPFEALARLAAAPPILRTLKRGNPVAINPEPSAAARSFAPAANHGPPPASPIAPVSPAAPATRDHETLVAPVAASVSSFRKPVEEPVTHADTSVEPDFEMADFDLEFDDLSAGSDQWQLKPSIDAAAPVSSNREFARVSAPAAVSDDHAPAANTYVEEEIGAIEFDEMLANEFASDFETVEVPDGVVAVADDLDLPELQVHEEHKAPDFDDFDTDFAGAFRQLGDAKRPVPASAAVAPANDPAKTPEQTVDQMLDADFAAFQRDFEENSGAFEISDQFDIDAGLGPRDPNRSRIPLYGAIFAGLLLFAGAGAYAFGMFGADDAGPPALVRADATPVKVKPETPGGVVVPNQDGKVYESVAGTSPKPPSQEKLVSTVEEPIAPAVKPARDPLPGVESTALKSEERVVPQETAPAAANEQVGIAPRKVRTMVVRPDGTLAPRAEPEATETPAAAAVEPVVPAPRPVEVAEAKPEPAAPAVKEKAAVEQVLAPKPVKTTTIKPKPAPEPEPAPQVAAAPQPAPVDMAGGAAVAASTGPVWSVQIASQPTRESAQASYESMARKYGGVIGGKGVNIVQANIEGKGTMWRVRIPAATRNDANILCAKLKTAGGSCFVSR